MLNKTILPVSFEIRQIGILQAVESLGDNIYYFLEGIGRHVFFRFKKKFCCEVMSI